MIEAHSKTSTTSNKDMFSLYKKAHALLGCDSLCVVSLQVIVPALLM
jgi:hypothetical protein